MALSAGARQAVGLATGWVVLTGAIVFSALYFSEIKDLARGMLGLPSPAALEAVRREGPSPGQGSPRSGVGRTVEIRAGVHGHYFARSEINGRPVDVLVDSGASMVALTYDDARRAGVYVRDSDFTQQVRTANGLARVAPVTLDRVSIGDVTVRNVPATVSEPGSLGTTLLGMSFLSRLQRV